MFRLFFDMMLEKPKSKGKSAPVRGRVIWYSHQGTMRVRTAPKLTKAEKKAAKKERRSLREAGDA